MALMMIGLSALSFPIFPQILDFHGFLSGWMAASGKEFLETQVGLRFLPDFSLSKSLGRERLLEAELSLNAWASAEIRNFDESHIEGKTKLYRAMVRYSSPRFEARLGLQKISFGSASFLRPLMWFDRLDPRDPLQITDGVYALLLRYYFLNNRNIWLWALYGNDDPKGWEMMPTAKRRPELGGRIQTPLSKGELAFTYHQRRVSFEMEDESSSKFSPIPENRYALDGKWDFGVGLWLEVALTCLQNKNLPYARQRSFVAGIDYTFNLGNGLHLLGEYFEFCANDNGSTGERTLSFVALSLAYPPGLLDTLNLIFYYDEENKQLYTFFRWQRSFDRLDFHLMAFWNPERFQIYRTQSASNLFAGKGIQLMMVFHY